MGSRIIAIADAFDSIISNRIYRNSIELDEALAKIKEGSGTQFDPVVVKAFEDCFDSIVVIINEDNKENNHE